MSFQEIFCLNLGFGFGVCLDFGFFLISSDDPSWQSQRVKNWKSSDYGAIFWVIGAYFITINDLFLSNDKF